MRHCTVGGFWLLLFVAAALSVAPAAGFKSAAQALQAAGPEQQVALEEMHYKDASLTGNVKYFEGVLADSYLETNANGMVSDRQQLLKQWRSGAFKVTSMEVRDLKVRAHRNVVVVSGRTVITAHLNGQDSGGTYQYTRVWLKEKGRWRVIALHLTLMPAAP